MAKGNAMQCGMGAATVMTGQKADDCKLANTLRLNKSWESRVCAVVRQVSARKPSAICEIVVDEQAKVRRTDSWPETLDLTDDAEQCFAAGSKFGYGNGACLPAAEQRINLRVQEMQQQEEDLED